MTGAEWSTLWRQRVQQEQWASLHASPFGPAASKSLCRDARLRAELNLALLNSPRVKKSPRVAVRRTSPRRPHSLVSSDATVSQPAGSPRRNASLRARPVLPPLPTSPPPKELPQPTSPRFEIGAQVATHSSLCGSFTGRQLQKAGVRYKNEETCARATTAKRAGMAINE